MALSILPNTPRLADEHAIEKAATKLRRELVELADKHEDAKLRLYGVRFLSTALDDRPDGLSAEETAGLSYLLGQIAGDCDDRG